MRRCCQAWVACLVCSSSPPCMHRLPQVGHLGPRYDAWVHQPVVLRAHPRFFQSDVLEVSARAAVAHACSTLRS